MSAKAQSYMRIQWLHKKVAEECYPSAELIAEKFGISQRQAQRDIEYLKKELGAPIVYSPSHKGYYYNDKFTLPILYGSENDLDYTGVISEMQSLGGAYADSAVTQMEIPYTAEITVFQRMAVMNLRKFIVEELPRHRYRCEFHSVELFLGVILSLDSTVIIHEPEWLRKKLCASAQTALLANLKPDEIEELAKVIDAEVR